MSMLNKKAMALYYPIIAGFVIALCTFYFLHTYKNAPKNTEFVGQVFLESYKENQNALKDMYYIQQSARYSVYSVMYPFAKRGFYFKDPRCSVIDEYILWEETIENNPCYPTEKDIKTNYALFLNKELNKYFEVYSPTAIPKNNYDFLLKEETITKIKAIATQNTIGSSNLTTYSFNPSFEIEFPYNFITKFTQYSTKAQQIKDNIKDCLRGGSSTPDDQEDLLTCSDIDIENYQITPIAFPKNYTLLFEIEDPSLENPYSEEKLTIKFGIRFLDTFPPPLTEIIGIKDSKLKWKKNNASDVISYSIYARALEPTYIDENDLIAKVESGTEWEIDYENTILKQGEKYYFYIIAHDNAGNTAETISPTELTI